MERKIAWFAGIIDGEGCIGAYDSEGTTPRVGLYIVNSSLPMMIEVKKIVTYLCGESPRVREKVVQNNKILFEMVVRKHNQLKIILRAIILDLVAKKDQAMALLEYLEQHKRHTKKGCDFTIISRLKELKRKSFISPVETERMALLKGDDATVRSAG